MLNSLGIILHLSSKKSIHTQDSKMVDDATLINTQHYIVRSFVKWINVKKGVAPSPTPRYSSQSEGSLRVPLDYGRQLYLLIVENIINFRTNFCRFARCLNLIKHYRA